MADVEVDTKDSSAVMDVEEKENQEPSGARRSSRSKKTVERLTSAAPKERVVIPGSGIPLGAIDNIRESVSKANIEDIKILHKILWGSDGKKTLRKRRIKEFNGVPEEMCSSLRKRVEKLKTAELKFCMQILDLKRSSDKSEMVETAVSFLKKPSGDRTLMSKTSKVQKLGSKKRKSAAKKRKKESGKKRTATSYMLFANSIREKIKKENPEKKMTDLAKIFGEKWRALSDEAKEPFKKEAERLKEEAGSAAPQKKKKPKHTKKKKMKKADPENEETDSDDDEDDEDEPLGLKTEDKLKASIDEIMDVKDLSSLSVRKIKDKLKDAYGEAVVKEHKSMIKTYIKSKVE
uniref:HMG box domain-containing protein n=2 Tax=Lotharella globosa TaxID=91324 RepID=A0A7S3ZBP1_9EUKA